MPPWPSSRSTVYRSARASRRPSGTPIGSPMARRVGSEEWLLGRGEVNAAGRGAPATGRLRGFEGSGVQDRGWCERAEGCPPTNRHYPAIEALGRGPGKTSNEGVERWQRSSWYSPLTTGWATRENP